MHKLVITEAKGLTKVTEIQPNGRSITSDHHCSLTEQLKTAVTEGFSEASIVYHSYYTATILKQEG